MDYDVEKEELLDKLDTVIFLVKNLKKMNDVEIKEIVSLVKEIEKDVK